MKTPAQLQIEYSHVMLMINLRRQAQDKERAREVKSHRAYRSLLNRSLLRLSASSSRLQRCLQSRGIA